jgi:PAS domain S-box-containing protein
LRRSMEQGADDFLAKPFRATTFMAAVDARLNRTVLFRAQSAQTEKRLQAIVEANQDLVAMADIHTLQILYLNRAGRELLGLAAHEDVSKLGLADFHSPEEMPRVRAEIIPAAIERGVWSGEVLLVSRSKVEVPVFKVVVAHKSSSGQVEFLSLNAHDLTRNKQMERERNRMEIQLRHAQKLESIGQMAAGIVGAIQWAADGGARAVVRVEPRGGN